MIKTITIFLLLVFIYLQYKLWFDRGGIPEMIHLHYELAQQAKENDLWHARNNGLQAEVNDLKTGRAAVEERARSELGMTKKDETFYQIVHSQPTKNP